MKFILHNTTEFTVSTLQTNFSSSTICSGESFADVDFSHSSTSIVTILKFHNQKIDVHYKHVNICDIPT